MSSWFDTMDLQVGQDYRDTPTWRTPCCWAVHKQRKPINSSQLPGYFPCLPLELFWLHCLRSLRRKLPVEKTQNLPQLTRRSKPSLCWGLKHDQCWYTAKEISRSLPSECMCIHMSAVDFLPPFCECCTFKFFVKRRGNWTDDVLCETIKIVSGLLSKAKKSGMFWKGMPTLSKIYGYEAILQHTWMDAFHPQWIPTVVVAILNSGYLWFFGERRAWAHSQPLHELKSCLSALGRAVYGWAEHVTLPLHQHICEVQLLPFSWKFEL